MKTIVVSFGAGAIAFAAYAYSPSYLSGPADAERVSGLPLNAVVRLDVEGIADNSGSGFAIGDNRILTNQHVIARAEIEEKPLRVRAWIAEGERVFPVIYTASVVRADRDVDLALLEIDGEWVGEVMEFADHTPRTGKPVCKAGSALGRLPQITCGLWGALDEEPMRGVRHASHSAPSHPGDSGGPVYDEDGRVVGVTRAVPRVGFGALITTMGLAIPLDVVREFLDADDGEDE